MNRKLVFILTLTLLIGTLTVALNIQPVESDYAWTETIYIQADGSIQPSTAPIASVDNVTYTLTDNIVGNISSYSSAIIIGRDNVIMDGAGYTLQGPQATFFPGIELGGRNNVTIKNMRITAFYYGVLLEYSSSNNSVSGNNITANSGYGICLDSFSNNNSITGNNITANHYAGIWLDSTSKYNSISGNTFTDDGIFVSDSYQNSVEDNTVNGRPLVYLEGVSNHTVVDAGQVILVRCEDIRVEGFNLSGTSIGIELWETSNSSISGNNIADNREGIDLHFSSDYNDISGNNITANSDYGIYLDSSSSNSISGNHITNNSRYGIYLYSSSNSSVGGNNVTDNSIGIELLAASNSSLSGNNISNNNNGMMLSDSSSDSISGNNITTNSNQGLVLDDSSNMSVSGNNITANHYEGISLSGNSFNNSISGNDIIDNMNGIALTESFNNSIFDNNITNNKCGVINQASSNNIFYHNNFVNNGVPLFLGQVLSLGSVNVWDNGYPFGGNYWSDYAGVDSNHDGVGDTPYTIDANNTDHYPLMMPYAIPEFPSILILPFLMALTMLTVITKTKAMGRKS